MSYGIEINFIAHTSYKIVFQRNVNCMAIFLVTIKNKFDFSSNIRFYKVKKHRVFVTSQIKDIKNLKFLIKP